MENKEKRVIENAESLNDASIDAVAGGGGINKLICCTCGREVRLSGPMMGQYYNNNICPFCRGRLKSW